MYCIKLDSEMNLVTTAKEPIYRGDNMARKILYLIPTTVGDIDMREATVYLSYIRADGTADIVLLERMEEKYNESYYQYTLPVTSTLTRYAGEVCTFLQIYSGSPRHPVIAKSGECILQVQASKNMDDYLADRDIGLIYTLQRRMENRIKQVQDMLCERVEQGLSEKADAIALEDQELLLLSGDTPLSAVDMSNIILDGNDIATDDGVEEMLGEVFDTTLDI